MLLQLLPSRCLLGRGPDGFPPRGGLRSVVCSSISQMQRFRTIDFESKMPLKWKALYRHLSYSRDSTPNVGVVLQQWERQQRMLIKWEAYRVAKELRKYRLFKLALDVYEWIGAQERFSFHSSDAAILLDLIYKVRGLSSAEDKFNSLPDALKDKRTYCSLLNVYAKAKEKEKAEGIFEIMKSKGYADSLGYNVTMTMYMDLNEHEKVISMITEMFEKNIRIDSFTVNIWLTACADMRDMEKMEHVVGLIESDKFGCINWSNYTTLATMLVTRFGQTEKAVKYIQEAESRVTGRDRSAFHYLISLYSHVGMKEDVYRTWHQYKSHFGQPHNIAYSKMLVALIGMGDVEGAELIYREWLSSAKKYDPRVLNILLVCYDKSGELSKAERCLEEMLNVGGMPYPGTLEILASLHIRHRQISKALSFLKEASNLKRPSSKKIWQPRVDTVQNFLTVSAEQGDQASIKSLIELLEETKCLDLPEYKSIVSAHAETALPG